MIDLTLTVGSILAICAVVAPVITTAMNNRHQLKVKRLELDDAQRQRETKRLTEIYDTYVSAAGACVMYPESADFSAFQAASAKAMLYAPEAVLPQMRNLAAQIEILDANQALPLIYEITQSLRATVQWQSTGSTAK